MGNLSISLVQSSIAWEDPVANRAHLEEQILALDNFGDLILLPETFTTGFSMNPGLAESMNLHTHKWMKQIAAHTQAVVSGSFIVRENNQYFNRLLVVYPSGHTLHYDKKHLFRMSEEGEKLTAGNQALTYTVKGWNIKPLICYDLRFPVWSRNVNLEYDLLLYHANWPAPRQEVWNTLLKARALENASYVAGVNITGEDGKNIKYKGGSSIIDFKGISLQTASDQSTIIQETLSKEMLESFRAKFPVHLDADRFNID